MIRKEAEWYVGSWLGGFEWRIFVGVDGFSMRQDGQLMLEEGDGLRMWSSVSFCG